MTKGLLRLLVGQLIEQHPLPWRIEYDWTVEVTDAKDRIVLKCMTAAQATELIRFAEQTDAYNKEGAKKVAKMLEG